MFDNLFSPIKINHMMVRNRIIATPTSDVFEEKALGGAGIVVAGHAIVEPGRSSYKSGNEKSIFDKYERQDTRKRVLKIHQAGAKASIEIFHAGAEARCIDYAKGPTSFIRKDGVEVKAMDEAMMEETLSCYDKVVKEAKKIGFDSLFLHFGHGWLPAQFLSPYFNHRQDEYGGSLENRMKFPLQILKTIREAVGPYYPIDMRISAYEWVEESIEFTDVLAFIKKAQQYIDSVQISAGLDMNREANVHMAPTNFDDRIPNLKWAKEVRANVDIPVSVVGAVLSPEESEEIIAKGYVDMVGCGRSLLADPDWPRKAMEGHPEDIRPCLRCLQCYHISTEHWNVGCSVNPRYNNEEFIPKDVTPARLIKNVVVIGGGPAGIQAAVTASKRGHKVTLLEKNSEVGGQLCFISQEYYKQEIKRLLTYLKVQLLKSDVEVQLNCNATKEMVAAMNPDAVIIAVGGSEVIPPIPGINRDHVRKGTEAIGKENELGQDIVVLGGGSIGSEIALELSAVYGRHVTIVEMADTLAAQGNLLYRIALHQKMEQTTSLDVMLETRCMAIEDNRVKVRKKDGTEVDIPYDDLIVCTGMRANQKQAEKFYGIVPDTNMIGDCIMSRKIQDAIFEGHTLALNL